MFKFNQADNQKIEKRLRKDSFCVVKNVIKKNEIKYLLSLYKKHLISIKRSENLVLGPTKLKISKDWISETPIKILDFQDVLLSVNGTKIIRNFIRLLSPLLI